MVDSPVALPHFVYERKSDVCKKGGLVSTSRTEEFSDGVFAIAATLLVLETQGPGCRAGRSLGCADRELALLRHLRGQLPHHWHNLGEPPRRLGSHKKREPSLTVYESGIPDGGRGNPVPDRLAGRLPASGPRRKLGSGGLRRDDGGDECNFRGQLGLRSPQ